MRDTWAYPPGNRGSSRSRTKTVGAAAVVLLILCSLLFLATGQDFASAAAGAAGVSGVTFPFNGVWLDSADGGHFWDASGSGLCRVDRDPASTTGFSENVATCDVQAKKPTQAVVDPSTYSVTTPYFVYTADMSSKSGGPIRLLFDPTADSGKGQIVPGSGVLLGGLNTVGFFSDAAGNFKNSSVTLGPCDHSPSSPIAPGTACKALYVGFERSKTIDRINFVDQPIAAQSIETISQVTDLRKGVRFGMGIFHNVSGTDDLYINELGGAGVSMITDVASCSPSAGSALPTATTPPQNLAGGCAASVEGRITTSFPQGMAIQNDAYGNGRYIYVADSPRNAAATVLRFSPITGLQDVVSSSVAPYDSLLNPGQTVSNYTFVLGLGLNPHNGDLYIGDDPTFAVLVNPPLNKGHLFTIAGVDGVAPADCLGTASVSCSPPAPPSVVTPSLYAYGLTAPKGGVTFVPSDDGGHLWAADHSQGLCRMDVVPAAPSLHAFNAASCDDGLALGSGGQTVYDDTVLPGTTNLHYLYVAQNDHLSPGVIRFTFDPSADGGAGALVAGSAVVMAPAAGLDGDKANGLALGPCKPGAPGSCQHALYMGGLLDGFIRRINNPLDDPRVQTVDVVAMTTEQRAGTAGRGINGSMGMIGDVLYLPENQGFTIIKNISQCPALVGGVTQLCSTTPLPIGQFGFIFGSAVGTDADIDIPDPNVPGALLHAGHSKAGLVYTAISPGVANATLYQYDVYTNTARIFATQGQMPPANSSAATVWCSTTCTRPTDPANPPGGLANFRFAQGIYVGPGGNVYITEDAFAGARGGRGHGWVAPFVAPPAPVASAPTIGSLSPTTVAPGATVTLTGTGFAKVSGVLFNAVPAANFAVVSDTTITAVVPPTATTGPITLQSSAGPVRSSQALTVTASLTCAVTINVPALAGGQSYWVQFTSHNAGTLSAAWQIPTAQSAKLLIYPGNPFTGLADPVSKGSVGGSIAQQTSSNATNLNISTAPSTQTAGTYTAQFFNGGKALPATQGTVTYTNDAGSGCPASPTNLHALP